MAQAIKELAAEDAVTIAFDLFAKLVDREANLKNVLLEELEPSDGGWIVSIGFDGSRQETSKPASGSMSMLTGLGNVRTTSVREVRQFYLGADGAFLKMG